MNGWDDPVTVLDLFMLGVSYCVYVWIDVAVEIYFLKRAYDRGDPL